jgi:S-adenosylmethionine decarboxylase proenzyme
MAKTKRSIQWVNPHTKFIRLKNCSGCSGFGVGVKEKNRKYAGIHLIAEFWGGKIIEDQKKIGKVLISAAKKANNIPLEVTIHKFQPQGITGVVLLAESHIALHSWSEFNYLAIDIFTCGEKAMPYKALEYLKKVFKPKKVQVKEIKRGVFPHFND